MASQSINLIAINPDVRRGRPIIAGTTICVSDVVMAMRFHDQDVDGLAAWFDLPLEKIHAAMTYYYQHKAEIDEEIRAYLKKADEFEGKRLDSNSL